MSSTVSFKVSKSTKEKMMELKDEVNWAEELRRFVELKIMEVEAKRNKAMIISELKDAPWSVPKGFLSRVVRDDRDSH